MEPRELDALVAEKVMGISLVSDTPAKIGAAVMSGFRSNLPHYGNGADGRFNEMAFDWNGQEHRLAYIESKWDYGGAYGNDGYGLWFWEQRQGMAWQADIEAHVSAWRAPVAKFSTDRAACGRLVDKMLAGDKADLFVMFLMDLYEGPELYCAVDNHVALARLLQDPKKCCLAALKALGIPIEGGE